MKHDLSNVEGAGERGLAACVLNLAWRDLRSKNECTRGAARRFWLKPWSSLAIWCETLDLDIDTVRRRIADEIDRSVQPER